MSQTNNRSSPSGIKLAHHFPSARHRLHSKHAMSPHPRKYVVKRDQIRPFYPIYISHLSQKKHRRICNFTMQCYANLRGRTAS